MTERRQPVPRTEQITIELHDDGPTLARPLAIAAALAVAVAIAVVVLSGGTGGTATRTPSVAVRELSPASVAATSGYPRVCLSVIISASYGRADFSRVYRCGRYNGSGTSLFHRLHGKWQPILPAVPTSSRSGPG